LSALTLGVAARPFVRAAEPEPENISFLDQLQGKVPNSITGNPAAVDAMPGTGLAGQLLHVPEQTGLRLGGVWLADSNGLLPGGAEPGQWSWSRLSLLFWVFSKSCGVILPVPGPGVSASQSAYAWKSGAIDSLMPEKTPVGFGLQ